MRYSLILGLLCGMSTAVLAADGPATVSELTANLNSKDQPARLAAIHALGLKHEKAAEAVPALTDLLKDESPAIRAQAAHALGLIGAPAKPAVTELIKLVGDNDAVVRRNAGGALMQIRPGPQVTIPLFAKLMEGSDAGLRTRAMAALAEAGDDAMPFLLASLKSEKAAYWSCLVLRDMGPKAKAAVPALTELLADKRPDVRREAILALAAIGEPASSAVPQLTQALDDKATCAAATYAFGSIGKASDEAEAKLRKNVDDPDKVTAAASIWAVAKLHPDNKQYLRRATYSLVKLLKDPDPRARKAAAHALAALRPGPEIMLSVTDELFKDADAKTVTGALDAMAEIGAPAVPRLVDALKFEKARPRVAYILGQIGPAAAGAVDALVVLIDDKNPETQNAALIALAKIGPAAKSAVPALHKALQEREGSERYAIVYALGRIGPDAIAAEPTLLKALESDDPSIALISAWALAQIDSKSSDYAAKSVPVLIRGLSDAAVPHRLAAAETLRAVAPYAKSAAPALKKATEDDDPAVAAAAAAALTAIGD